VLACLATAINTHVNKILSLALPLCYHPVGRELVKVAWRILSADFPADAVPKSESMPITDDADVGDGNFSGDGDGDGDGSPAATVGVVELRIPHSIQGPPQGLLRGLPSLAADMSGGEVSGWLPRWAALVNSRGSDGDGNDGGDDSGDDSGGGSGVESVRLRGGADASQHALHCAEVASVYSILAESVKARFAAVFGGPQKGEKVHTFSFSLFLTHDE
jgi:hypothetical protein